jgi:hypothetical protein
MQGGNLLLKYLYESDLIKLSGFGKLKKGKFKAQNLQRGNH